MAYPPVPSDRCPLCYCKFIDPDTGNPTWHDDPILTKNGLAGENYKGTTPARWYYIKEIRDKIKLIDDTVTWKEEINKSTPIRWYHILEIRNAIEKILGITETSTPEERAEILKNFLNFDNEGNQYGERTEWIEKDLNKGTPLRAWLIEDLRKNIITMFNENFRLTPTEPERWRNAYAVVPYIGKYFIEGDYLIDEPGTFAAKETSPIYPLTLGYKYRWRLSQSWHPGGSFDMYTYWDGYRTITPAPPPYIGEEVNDFTDNYISFLSTGINKNILISNNITQSTWVYAGWSTFTTTQIQYSFSPTAYLVYKTGKITFQLERTVSITNIDSYGTFRIQIGLYSESSGGSLVYVIDYTWNSTDTGLFNVEFSFSGAPVPITTKLYIRNLVFTSITKGFIPVGSSPVTTIHLDKIIQPIKIFRR